MIEIKRISRAEQRWIPYYVKELSLDKLISVNLPKFIGIIFKGSIPVLLREVDKDIYAITGKKINSKYIFDYFNNNGSYRILVDR